jgi:hypothetical protein
VRGAVSDDRPYRDSQPVWFGMSLPVILTQELLSLPSFRRMSRQHPVSGSYRRRGPDAGGKNATLEHTDDLLGTATHVLRNIEDPLSVTQSQALTFGILCPLFNARVA